MTSDPQGRAVYVMERRELRGHYRHTVDRDDLRRALRRLARSFDTTVPPLNTARLSRYGVWEDGVITLDSERGCNYLTLAHEMAHHVTYERHGYRVQDHGPTFVRVYAQALDILRVVPFAGMRAICRKYRVRIA